VEIQQLRCAVAVADHGSFTRAAAALHVTQPTLSYTITKLERELGARLFERTSARSILTAAGEAFIGPARRALAEARRSQEAVDAVAGLLGGELRVVGIRTAVTETAQRTAAFCRHYPAVRLVVETPTFDDDVLELVRTGRCDIGIMRAVSTSSDVVAVALGRQEMVVLFPAHFAPKRASVSVPEMVEVPLVAPIAGSRLRHLHDSFLHEHNLRASIAAECSHVESSIELVRGGLGAFITTRSHVETLHLDDLVVKSFRPRITVELVAVRRPSASPAALAFSELLDVNSPRRGRPHARASS
jgi:DNA-binding transcriptional LysR family regulator